MTFDEYLTIAEVAALLGLSPSTIKNQIHNGAITAEKRGRAWFIHEDEAFRYHDEQQGQIGRPKGLTSHR